MAAPLYGVIGFPVKHSLSPAMFAAAFWEYNMNATYEKFEVAPDALGDFLADARRRPISGLSVTIPHKTAVMDYLDSVDTHASVIGAVNTVVNKKGKLKGYNTDWTGAQRAIEDVMELKDKDVLVLGAGGAAAAIIYACGNAGARVTILNRTLDKAQELAERFGGGIKVGLLSDILQYRANLLIHTTSIGMGPDAERSLVPVEFFRKGLIVFDIVYTPLENRLVREARRAGCRVIPGYKMLLYQGEKQFELWFKKKPRTDKMEEALLRELVALDR
ncbi:shikimate dehydrogenase [Patescibacteria group bacterium]|nr:shikimate dehydrogenase [Patescibacteria group bacterium]MBU1703563.1 shikimate dehydrogenase [Patescibacteria group bacterium]MBU1954289.1 shikimate dehydrogenase [Patescibacteria group bacterium]